MPSKWTRRSLLAGLSGAALMPFVPMLHSDAEAAGPTKRVVFVFTPNGQWHPTWQPSGGETNFTLGEILQPLEPLRSEILVVEGVDMRSFLDQGSSNAHPPAVPHVLTANDATGGPDANGSNWYATDISIDQYIANRIGQDSLFASLVLGVESGGGHLSRLSYRGAQDPVPPRNDPQSVFDDLFADLDLAPAEQVRLRAERRSVIDGVLDELAVVRDTVGKDDRNKIDAHLAGLRVLEKRFEAQAGDNCTIPDMDAHDAESYSFIRDGELQMDLLSLALACNLTRVVNLIWSYASSGGGLDWDFIGHPTGHHKFSHFSADGYSIDEQKQALTDIGNWYAERFASLLQRLQAIGEAESNLLNNTAVVWYSEHASTPGTPHQRTNLPFVLAGRCAGALDVGRYVDVGGVPHNDLFITLCHAMGLDDVDTFGKPSLSNGPVSQLLA